MDNQHSTVSPAITTMIRLDHTHVLAAFHRYHLESALWRKRAIVNSACTALEIHAQLEEEIFYPALERVSPDDEALQKSRPEHEEMRATIRELRSLGPENDAYDRLFMQLMRATIHHVADEETVLLPIAERSLKHELRSLGAAMTRRRMELLSERPMDIAINTMGTFPVATALLATAFACGIGSLLRGGRGRREHAAALAR
jgi:hypothetical protein